MRPDAPPSSLHPVLLMQLQEPWSRQWIISRTFSARFLVVFDPALRKSKFLRRCLICRRCRPVAQAPVENSSMTLNCSFVEATEGIPLFRHMYSNLYQHVRWWRERVARQPPDAGRRAAQARLSHPHPLLRHTRYNFYIGLVSVHFLAHRRAA